MRNSRGGIRKRDNNHTNRQKHLELIIQIIERMAKNSAMYKGWTITILSILSAVAIDKDEYRLMYIGIFVVVSFYIADVYYLWLEQLFVNLYNDVALKKEIDIDYSMDIAKFKVKIKPWKAIKSTSQLFYLIILTVLVVATVLLNRVNIAEDISKEGIEKVCIEAIK